MKLLAKVGSLALIAAVAGGVVAGCSSNDASKPETAHEGAKGSVGLSLQPVSGITLNSVHYVVTKAGVTGPVLEGDLPTPGNAATFNFALPLAVGTGYSITLSGTSVESTAITCVGTSGVFDVTANASAGVNLVLVCTDARDGSVKTSVSLTTDACPKIIVDYIVATPNAANVGSPINVAASARDLDGKTITYAWTSPAGTFAPANGKTSVLSCATAGANQALTLTASNGECTKALGTTVSCNNVLCGNNVLDAGEACDPTVATSAPCLPNCTKPVCGNGKVDAPFETCDPTPADPGNCNPSTCQTVVAKCGDGLLTLGEKCDGALKPPGSPAGACLPDCSGFEATVVCGDGAVGAGEICDPALTVNNCGRDCKAITSAACLACEDTPASCADFVSCEAVAGNAAAGTPAAGTPKKVLCNETLDCVRDTKCAADGAAPIKCYCGTANPTDCQAGLGNGLCKAEIERSLETTSFNTIAQRIGNTVYGGGQAMARIDCDQAFCPTQCF